MEAHAVLSLCVAGLILLVVGGLFEALDDAETTATVLSVAGAGALLLALVLPRVEHAEVGPGHLKFALKSLDDELESRMAGPTERARAYQDFLDFFLEAADEPARRSWRRERHRPQSDLESFSQQASKAPQMAPIAVTDVPDEAIAEIEKVSRASDVVASRAKQRTGRGAPRWEIETAGNGTWEVTHTRWGWTASPLDGG